MVESLLEDIFKVDKLDPDGKKFDKGEKFLMVLASTLNLDGTPDSGYYTQGGRKSLADKFEYVMHGKLYRISDASGPNAKVEICVSFGGLLMLLKGEPGFAQKFELDQRLFLLIRKTFYKRSFLTTGGRHLFPVYSACGIFFQAVPLHLQQLILGRTKLALLGVAPFFVNSDVHLLNYENMLPETFIENLALGLCNPSKGGMK